MAGPLRFGVLAVSEPGASLAPWRLGGFRAWRILGALASWRFLLPWPRKHATATTRRRRVDMSPPFSEPSASLDELAHRVIGAAIEVHRALGPGHLEAAYEAALVLELRAREIPCERQVPVAVIYKGQPVGEARIDLIVDGRLLVELKATEAIAPIHLAQTLSYLKVTGISLGLVISFNVSVLGRGVRRVIWSGSALPAALEPVRVWIDRQDAEAGGTDECFRCNRHEST